MEILFFFYCRKKFLHSTDDFLQCVKVLHSHTDYIHLKAVDFQCLLQRYSLFNGYSKVFLG
jgi:hypothetical protein